MREYQKYFNQAFNLAASAADITYSSTQTIAGGLIICRRFTVNASVTLTISNPTTIVCEQFVNNGTITMSAVTEAVLSKHRQTDLPTVVKMPTPYDFMTNVFSTTALTTHYQGGLGGYSFGDGGVGGMSGNGAVSEGGSFRGAKFSQAKGLGHFSCPLWWPIAYFRNPILGQSGGANDGKPAFACSLAFQRKGSYSTSTLIAANDLVYQTAQFDGGNPGSFIEVFSKGDVTINGNINATGATGAGSGSNTSGGGGGGGGGIGIYSETKITVTAVTLSVAGGAGGTVTSQAGGGGGGGGGIFLAAPVITQGGTLTVSGGAAGGGGGTSQAGQAGISIVEQYLRLWMPNEDDTLTDTRYSNNGT